MLPLCGRRRRQYRPFAIWRRRAWVPSEITVLERGRTPSSASATPAPGLAPCRSRHRRRPAARRLNRRILLSRLERQLLALSVAPPAARRRHRAPGYRHPRGRRLVVTIRLAPYISRAAAADQARLPALICDVLTACDTAPPRRRRTLSNLLRASLTTQATRPPSSPTCSAPDSRSQAQPAAGPRPHPGPRPGPTLAVRAALVVGSIDVLVVGQSRRL